MENTLLLNLMLTKGCNLSCSFCFAVDAMEHQEEISIENFRKFLSHTKEWEKDTKISYRFVGGEPTLHSQFPKLLDILQYEYEFSSLLIFTNSIVSKENVDRLYRLPRSTFVVNLLSPEQLSPSKQEKSNYFFEKLHKKHRISIGTTLNNINTDLNYLIDTAKKYKIKQVRLGIAQPIFSPTKGTMNIAPSLIQSQEMAKKVALFVQKAHKKNLKARPDCGHWECVYDEAMIKLIKRYNDEFVKEHQENCRPFTISPDMKMFVCFVVEGLYNDKSIFDFQTSIELKEYFDTSLQKLEAIPAFEECKSCEKFLTTCIGGCLGAKAMMAQKSEIEIL